MKALVTGGAGFIGSALSRRLLGEGHDVRAFDNLITGMRDAVPRGVDFVEGDLLDADAIGRACAGVDVVFHIGALRSIERSVEEPLLVNAVNVAGTLHVLRGAEAAGVGRVVFASSSSVYGNREDVMREDMLPAPMSPYAASKLAAEQYCSVWSRLGRVQTVALRYFNVFGPGMHAGSKYALVFAIFATELLSGVAPTVHWDGEQAKDFTFVDDVVGATMLAAEAPDHVDGRVINVGAGSPKTVNEVLRAVSDAVGTWIEPVHAPRREGDVRRTHADVTLARELLGWEPSAGWRDAVEATVAYYRDQLQPRR